MNENEAKKFSVSKMDAAKRQLDSAIRLWFADGDPVSIHTLVGAAYQIIHDINKHKERKDLIFDGEFIKDEHRATVRDWLRKDFMFFKHADRNPDGITEFVPLGNLMFMLCGIQTLRDLGERTSDVQNIFSIYMAFTKPEYISAKVVATLKASTPRDYSATILNVGKDEFLKMSLEACGILRSQGKID
ncbi:MAG: hypothetical protein A3F74_27095 [Betaproteobacteria bacterium RIFCSPLOWO2_12_FULL_62_58]|nr:MAG: hypothetical protein A3F74_27095 [Betaproteobacteria bacterium RIFCSPLOWO2_12_FULL_62_58]